jgi:hypothetical protein
MKWQFDRVMMRMAFMMSFMRTIIAKLSTLHNHEKHIKCVNHVLVHVSPMSPVYTGQA